MKTIFDDGLRYFKRVAFGEENINEISRIRENLIFKNRFISIYNDDVYFPGGITGTFLRLETPERRDGSIIVVIDHLHRLAVVKQFRYSARVWEIGFPRGFCNRQDFGAFITGWREFSEEVGGQVDEDATWSLGRVLPDSGKLFDAPYIIMSRLKHKEGTESYHEQNPDKTEAITHKTGGHWISYFELRSLIESGYITDMFTCAAFARLRPHFDEIGTFQPDEKLLSGERLSRSDLDFR